MPYEIDDSWQVSGVCARCGHNIDGHISATNHFDNTSTVIKGYKFSLANCCLKHNGYTVRKKDVGEFVYSMARRLFLCEEDLAEYVHDGETFLKKAEKLLNKKGDEWGKEKGPNVLSGGSTIILIQNIHSGSTQIGYYGN